MIVCIYEVSVKSSISFLPRSIFVFRFYLACSHHFSSDVQNFKPLATQFPLIVVKRDRREAIILLRFILQEPKIVKLKTDTLQDRA